MQKVIAAHGGAENDCGALDFIQGPTFQEHEVSVGTVLLEAILNGRNYAYCLYHLTFL